MDSGAWEASARAVAKESDTTWPLNNKRLNAREAASESLADGTWTSACSSPSQRVVWHNLPTASSPEPHTPAG